MTKFGLRGEIFHRLSFFRSAQLKQNEIVRRLVFVLFVRHTAKTTQQWHLPGNISAFFLLYGFCHEM